MMRVTLPSRNAARPWPQPGSLARARRADAKGDVVFADGVEIYLLADGFGGDAGFAVVGHDPVADQRFERFGAFVF